MEDYPKELIDGVTPLVFAVDAVFVGEENATNTTQKSTAFETFFNYISSKKQKVLQTGTGSQQNSSAPLDPLSDILSSDPALAVAAAARKLPSFTNSRRSSNHNSKSSDFFSHARVVPVSSRHAFPPSKDPHGNQNAIAKLNHSLYAARKHKTMPAPSQNNPYSGNGNGNDNATSPLVAILAKNPIQGILPEGWFEKHTHALPSTLLIVTSLSLTASAYDQALLEQHLATTIENITATSAKKRESPIHVVCLIQLSGTIATAKEVAVELERIGNIRAVCRLGSGAITPWHYFGEKDGRTGEVNTIFVKDDFQKLQKAVEGESMLYYLTQVRRCKRKHASLHHGTFVELLPYAARYCIKIALFYEFQACTDQERGEKSTRYWREAYRNVRQYYQYLQGKTIVNSAVMKHVNDAETENLVTTTVVSDDSETAAIDSLADPYMNTNGAPPPPPPPPPPPDSLPSSESDDGVEVALMYSPRTGNGKISIDPDKNESDKKNGIPPELVNESDKNRGLASGGKILTHSEDMIQQCRAVADIVNIKLLLTNYASAIRSLANADSPLSPNSDKSQANPFTSLAMQISTHAQVFLSTPRSLSKSRSENAFDPHWYFLSFVARQRLVVSEFLEKYPISKNVSVHVDIETASICNSCSQHMSCGEAYLKLASSVIRNLINGQETISDGADDKRRFVGCLSNQDIAAAWDIESKKDHLGLALEYLTRAVEIFTVEIKGSEEEYLGQKPLARAYYLIAGILMKQEEYKKALMFLRLASSVVSHFPAIQTAVEVAIAKCLELSNEQVDEKTAAMQLLNCSSNGSFTKSRLSSLCDSIGRSYMTEVTWPYESQSSQALQYSFTFPSSTCATEGDTVQASLYIMSRLPFPVKIERVDLTLNIGNATVEQNDSLLFPGQTIILDSRVSLPNGCLKDVDPKILDRQAVKRPRRTTFGLTKIGGALFGKGAVEENLSGGFVIACLDAKFNFSIPEFHGSRVAVRLQNHHRGSFPIQLEESSGESKRASLEEDNFIYSAWSRPECFPISAGPRCLRVLRAQPLLEIIDLTSDSVGKKAMEGTVNRFMLHLKAGAMETCLDLRMRVSCASWVDTVENYDHETIDTGIPSETTAPSRLPILVSPCYDSLNDSEVDGLPGWRALGSSEGEISEQWISVAERVGDAGSVTFVDLYRPLSKVEEVTEYHCKTRFTVDIAYKQIRHDQEHRDREHASVVKTYQGTVKWCSPFDTKFDSLPRKEVSTPSGSRHPTNFVGGDSFSMDNKTVISGSHVPVTVTLTSREAANNLAVEVNHVRYQSIPDDEECRVSLVQRKNALFPDVLYTPKSDDFCNQLRNGSRLKIGYTICPEVNAVEITDSEYAQAASAPLGAISIAWTPMALPVPDYISELAQKDEFARKHGPLPIKDLPQYCRTGPTFYVEATPFDASFETVPSMPKVAVPFEVRYTVTNTTKLQQRIRVCMTESASSTNDMLVSGIINGDLLLGPSESKCLRYSLLVTKVGKTILPALNVSSLRFDTWIIRSGNQDCIYVLP